ncbi:MAG: hypothetical protein E6R04_06995 [Spirochaetes bacterium]|nr:MAG: hypothetical protein E6R04_06995 [Spirochaetota bacterium]
MSLPLGCRQCRGSGMVEILNRPIGTYRTPMGNVIQASVVTILCDCERGRAMQEKQGGEGRTSGKMPIFDPMTMELANVRREKPVNVSQTWESF